MLNKIAEEKNFTPDKAGIQVPLDPEARRVIAAKRKGDCIDITIHTSFYATGVETFQIRTQPISRLASSTRMVKITRHWTHP
jgi:hypothetical protein